MKNLISFTVFELLLYPCLIVVFCVIGVIYVSLGIDFYFFEVLITVLSVLVSIILYACKVAYVLQARDEMKRLEAQKDK